MRKQFLDPQRNRNGDRGKTARAFTDNARLKRALNQNTARVAAEAQLPTQEIQFRIVDQPRARQIQLDNALVAGSLGQQETNVKLEHARIYKLRSLGIGHDNRPLVGRQKVSRQHPISEREAAACLRIVSLSLTKL